MWRALMKDCAFYYDAPTIKEELSMQKTIQRKYDSLLQPGWKAQLACRKDLVTWACNSYNSNLQAREDFDGNLADCENYSALLKEFGPDYSKLKGKLGHIKGLFD